MLPSCSYLFSTATFTLHSAWYILMSHVSSLLLLLLLPLLPTWLWALCADSACCDNAYMRVPGPDLKALKCCGHWTEVIALSARCNLQLSGSERAGGPSATETCHRPCVTRSLILKKKKYFMFSWTWWNVHYELLQCASLFFMLQATRLIAHRGLRDPSKPYCPSM